MKIFRTDQPIAIDACEHFRHGDWKKIHKPIIRHGMILTEVTDQEHDGILNLSDMLDPLGLRGFEIQLKVRDRDHSDPASLCLMAVPQTGQVLKHEDRYYMVETVIQSTAMEIIAFVKRLGFEESMALML